MENTTDLESALERRRRLFDKVFADFRRSWHVGLRMADNLPREALYDRSAIRSDAESASRPKTDG